MSGGGRFMAAQQAARSSPQSIKEAPWGDLAAHAEQNGALAFGDLFKKVGRWQSELHSRWCAR